MPTPRLIIVTGANRGIGRAICDNILSRPNVGPLKLFATSRKGEDLGLNRSQDGSQEVLYPRLDISSRDSIHAFRDNVTHHGKVDVLINNAGVNLDDNYSPENAKQTLDVNYRGTLEMCKAFLPHMNENGRIVNLSSVASKLQAYSPEIQARFRNAASCEEVEQLAQEFESTVRSSTEQTAGFGPPPRSYSISKSLVNSLTRILSSQNPNLLINSCCPGWVSTEMGSLVASSGIKPPKSPKEGARIPVRLGFGDLGGVSGEWWANDSVRSKEEGKVQEW